MIRFKTIRALASALLAAGILAGCAGNSTPTSQVEAGKSAAPADAGVVNLYTDRHYDTDDALYAKFKEETGITVNVVKGKSDELIERLKTEGADTEADLFVTADAGRLQRAKEADVLQAFGSQAVKDAVPENLRDADDHWTGLTKRARVIVYAKDRVDPATLSTYAALAGPAWKGRVLVRGADSIYNQTLVASFLELDGEEETGAWVQGIVANMAQDPQGGDRDQAKAVVAGVGDVAIMNTYYLGLMLKSSDPEEVKVAESVGVFFPDQEGDGTHINVSGAGIVKASRNKGNAEKLLEFLTSPAVQKLYAEENAEYPVVPGVEPSEFLQGLGGFKEQGVPLHRLGELNREAVQLLNRYGWK
ncbi:Fe(3+) ABC transporter substrate-binding protein [Anaerotalea alkaliphila]|uniref:Fe(3+) ABC transporter substrate-binding protein n=1 Tax=Anaerotalea alkaliphila TaxID=2662126 RepID=A0A7X5HV87_9FIRM|nr:Fe(3+) ABC transporter substrate-binding protein [Anaerotalea alkaliphila]NDL67273.1 Fe(3+) ABC transporter substrate-binding protein [Anaerotalea alkaliphila]